MDDPDASPAGEGTPEVRSTRRRLAIGGAVLAVALVAAGVALATRDDEPEAAAPTTTTATSTTTAPASTTTQNPFPECIPVPEGTGPVGPLTGQPVEAPGAEQRPALVVKIDNYEPDARPQAGLSRADIVFEERVEGGVTRFAAVFQSTSSDVGPVRSARSTDVGIVAQFGRALFAYSGANPDFLALVASAPLVDVGANRSGAYYRSGDKPAPHNLFAHTDGLWASGSSSAPAPLWPFRAADAPAPDGRDIASASYSFGGPYSGVRWEWDAAAGSFARVQNGTPHIDAAFCQVHAQNVVVQLVEYVPSATNDAAGNPIPEAVLVGEGKAWILTGGRAIEGSWRRDSQEQPTAYLGPDGEPVALAPGRTWVGLVPRANAVTFG